MDATTQLDKKAWGAGINSDPRLSQAHRQVCSALFVLGAADDPVKISQKELAEKSGLNEIDGNGVIHDLRRCGWIEIHRDERPFSYSFVMAEDVPEEAEPLLLKSEERERRQLERIQHELESKPTGLPEFVLRIPIEGDWEYSLENCYSDADLYAIARYAFARLVDEGWLYEFLRSLHDNYVESV